jgi:hypothetical protein
MAKNCMEIGAEVAHSEVRRERELLEEKMSFLMVRSE